MAHIITVINNKGGTGKTTTVLNLGAALAKRRKRVLLIDLDAQGNLTSALGEQPPKACIGEVLLGKVPIEEAMVRIDRLSLLSASDRLLEYETQLTNEPGREFLLREALASVQESFDFIVIDCPPSLGTLSLNSLVAAQHYIVPMQAENFAYIGLDRILLLADKVKRRMNPALELAGILFVKLNPRTNFSKAMIRNLSENKLLSGRLFDTYIRQDIALMESSAFKKSIFEYSPNGRGSEDYARLAKEIMKIYG